MTGFTQPCAKAEKYEIFAYNRGTSLPKASITIIVNKGAQEIWNIIVTDFYCIDRLLKNGNVLQEGRGTNPTTPLYSAAN